VLEAYDWNPGHTPSDCNPSPVGNPLAWKILDCAEDAASERIGSRAAALWRKLMNVFSQKEGSAFSQLN
jgi:hypothetical protein